MSRDRIKPTITIENAGSAHECERYSHPAYGLIELNRFTCMPHMQMFGSALKHYAGVSLTIKRAVLDRSLNSDHIHEKEEVLRLNMSEAQWASFVSSMGQGSGTPITFEHLPARPYKLEMVPGIIGDSVRETFSKEIKNKAEVYVKEAKRLIEQLRILLDSNGSVSKKTLRELVDDLDNTFGGLPNSMKFIQDQFDEKMEETVQAGRSEIEGFTRNMLMQAGLKHLIDKVNPPQIEGEVVNQITDKEKKS